MNPFGRVSPIKEEVKKIHVFKEPGFYSIYFHFRFLKKKFHFLDYFRLNEILIKYQIWNCKYSLTVIIMFVGILALIYVTVTFERWNVIFN